MGEQNIVLCVVGIESLKKGDDLKIFLQIKTELSTDYQTHAHLKEKIKVTSILQPKK